MTAPTLSPPSGAPQTPARRTDEGSTDVSIVGLLNVVLRYRWSVVATAVVTAALLAGLAALRDRTYTATASFVPQSGKASPNLAGLAAQFGVNVQNAEATQSPDFYADLLKSREILRGAVTSTYTLPTDSGVVRTTLVPVFGWHEEDPRRREDEAMRVLGRRLGVAVSTRTGVVSTTVQSVDPDLSAQIAERLLALLSEFNLERRRSQAAAEREFVERRLAEVRRELRTAERRLEAFYLRNRDYANSPTLRFEQDRLSKDLSMHQQLFSTLAESFEQAKIDEVRDTPVITVIEPPVVPVRPDPRGLALKAVAGLVGGGILGVLIAFLRHGLRRAGDDRAPEYEEFQQLRREAVADVVHPWRPVARLLGRRADPDAPPASRPRTARRNAPQAP